MKMGKFFRTGLDTEKIILASVIAGIFIPRLVSLDSFFIQDEHVWLNRSHLYAQAWTQRNWEAMAEPQLSNHPGVTLMTVVAPVISRYANTHELPIFEAWPLEHQRPIAREARLVVGSVYSLLLLVLYAILRRSHLFARRPWWAAVAVIMLGLEPWVWGISRTIHLDSLLALFLVLSLVTGAVARGRKHPGWAAGAGVWWALAFLTKSPALIILPLALIGLLLRPLQEWRVAIHHGLIWIVAAIATIYIVWPPMWAHPLQRLSAILSRVLFHSSAPEAYLWPGTHPPFFVFVLSALTTLGVLFYITFRLGTFFHKKYQSSYIPADLLLIGGLLFAFTLVYLQGDHARKNVPALALFVIPAVAGWLMLARRLRIASPVTAFGLLLIQALLVGPWFPHLTSAYNPLFPSDEGKRLLVDIGNGTSLVAEYVNTEAPGAIIATNLPGLIQPYLRPEYQSNVRRLPEGGRLDNIAPDVTHVIVPFSFPARGQFDSTAKTLIKELAIYRPVKTIVVRDVPLFAIYQIQPKQ